MNLKARSRTVTRLQLCGILLFYLTVDIRMQSTQLQIQSPKTSLTDCAEIHGAFYSSSLTRFYTICVKSIALSQRRCTDSHLGQTPGSPPLTLPRDWSRLAEIGASKAVNSPGPWVCGKWKVAELFCNSQTASVFSEGGARAPCVVPAARTWAGSF